MHIFTQLRTVSILKKPVFSGCSNSLVSLVFKVICFCFFLFAANLNSWGQLASWDPSGLSWGPNPWAADTVYGNITVTGLVRGAGFGVSGSPAADSYGGSGADQNSQANAISNGDFYTMTLKANAGYKMSITGIPTWFTRRSGTGTCTIMTQYSLNGSSFTDIGSVSITSTSGTGTNNPLVFPAGVLTALADLPSTTTVTLRFVVISSANRNLYFAIGSGDRFVINGSSSAAICSAPSTQASGITFSGINSNSLGVNWTNGNGAGRVVKINTSNSFTAPADASDPTANLVYGGSGEQVVFNGTGSGPITITGLTPSTTYYFRVYEYCSTDRTYQTATATNNSNNQTTLSSGTPVINTSGTLSALSTVYGTASSTTNFTVGGSALTANIIITAPSGFEISSNGGTSYSTSVTLTPTSGTVATTSILVRLAATTGVGTYSGNVTCTSTGATTQTVATASSTVTAKSLTITGLSAANKVYDQNTTVSVTGTPAYAGLVNSETFAVSGSVTWTFPDANVGTNKVLTRTGIYNAPSSNYTVTQPSLTASITAVSLTISGAAASNKAYDGNTSATITGILSGVLPSDNVTLSGTGTFASPNVANNITVTSTSTIGGTHAANYTLTQPTGLTANITQASQTITFPAIPAKTTADVDFSPGATASSGLTVTYTSSNPAVATIVGGNIHIVGVGSAVITASQGGNTNYAAAADVQQTLIVSAGPCMSTSFPAATLPAGWSGSSANATTSAHYQSAPNTRQITSSAELITATVDNPSSISFYVDASGSGGQTGTLAYRVGSGSWITIGTFTASTAGNTETFGLTSSPNLTSLTNVSFRFTSSANSIYIDDVDVFCAPGCTEPATQASAFTVNTSTPTSLNLNFIRGNGDAVIAIARSGSAATDPSSNTAYNLGDPVGGGTVVYKGTASGINSATTQTIGSLSAETQYFFNLYELVSATNCYKLPKVDASAWTLSTLPSAHAASFTCNAASYNQINLSFSAANTLSDADGYIVLQRVGSAPTSLPVNGTSYTVGGTIGDATVAAIINSTSATSQSVGSLTGSTNYYFALIPFNWNGVNAPTYNYRTTATIPSSNCTTPTEPSMVSDIVDAGDVSVYTSNINYLTWQSNTISNTGSGTNGSIGVFKFIIRDGGSSMSDSDVLPTILTAININYAGAANTIRSAALFNGNSFVAMGTVSANSISFSGLSGANVTANDNGSQILTLRVTFNTSVTDNDKLVFSVASATAGNSSASSQFTTISAQSENISSNDRNRIEVSADRLALVQQPNNTPINVSMSPAVTIAANDVNGNRDLDFTGLISVTSTGTLTGAPISVTAASGLATYNTLTHTVAGTGFVLNGTSSGLLATGNSNTFDITTVVNGSYRTASSGTWPTTAGGNATWERFLSGSWGPATKPAANVTDMLYIRHTVTTNAAFSAPAPGTNMTVENNGVFNGGHNSTFASLTIQSGGVFSVNNPAVTIHSTGTVNVESAGRLILNSATLDNGDGFWNGTENFHNGSTVELQNWDWDAGSSANRLLDNPIQISANADGYRFGNFYFNANPDENFNFITGIPSSTAALKLIQNNLTINNASTSAVQLVVTTQNVEIGGDVIVQAGDFRTSVLASSVVNHTIKGDLVMNGGTINLNPTLGGSNGCVINLEGDLILNAGTLLSTDLTGCSLDFTGTTTQSIDVKNAVGMAAIKMNVFNTESVRLVNQNLLLGNNCDLTVKTGGVFNFNFDNSNTALYVGEISSANVTSFSQEANGTIKITSPQGIIATGAIGNVQTDTRTFNSAGIFHYIGRATQITNSGLPSALTGKVIVELDDDVITLSVTSPSRTISAPGILEIKKGTLLEGGSSSFFTGDGLLTMTGGTYQISTVNTGATILPRLTGTYNLTGGTVELNGATPTVADKQVLRGGRNYYNVKISGSSTNGQKEVSSSITIRKQLEITGTAIFDTQNSGVTGSGGLTMSGGRWKISKITNLQPELVGDSTAYALTGGTIELYGTTSSSGNQQIRTRYTTGNTQSIIYNNVELKAVSANTDNFNITTATQPLNVAGQFDVDSLVVFQLDATNFITGPGTFNLKRGSMLKYANANGITTAPSSVGAVTTAVRNFSSYASYGFVGNASPQAAGNGLPARVANLYVQKGGAAHEVTVAQPVKVANTLKMQIGNISNATNVLELGISTDTVGTLDYGDGHIIGTMKRWFRNTNSGNASGLFPLGTSTLDRFVTVEYATAPTAGSLTASFVPTNMGLSGLPQHIIASGICSAFTATSTADEGYWQIDDADDLAGGTYNITLVGESFTTVTDVCELTALKREGSNPWEQSGTHTYEPTSTVVRPIVKRTGASGWSNWGFGGGSVNPLPVELIAFDGSCEDNIVTLRWSTASELNSKEFIVEKSDDLKLFEYATSVLAAGNSNTVLHYEVLLPRSEKVSYYRLRQEDFNGAYEYFGPISVSCHGGLEEWRVYVDHAVLYISADELDQADYIIQVSDINGKSIYSEKISNQISVYRTKDMGMVSAGIYTATIYSQKGTKAFKFVIVE